MCTSVDPTDLQTTDSIALKVMEDIVAGGGICGHMIILHDQFAPTFSQFSILYIVSEPVRQQYEDNIKWIKEADSHDLVGILQ